MNHEPHSQALHVHWEDARLEFSSATPQGQRGHGTTNYGWRMPSQKTSKYITSNMSNIQENNPSKATDTLLWEIGWNCHDSRWPRGSRGWLSASSKKKKRLPKQVPRLLGKKTKCGMVSLRMARHNVNFYSAIVNFLNFTQLIGAWHSRVKWKWDVTTGVKRIENR